MILSLVASVWITILVWRRRSLASVKAVIFLAVSTFVWTLGFYMEANSTTLGQQLFFNNIGYMGSMSVPVAWFVFCLKYVSGERFLTRWQIAALYVFPVIIMALVWTNGLHHLMWSNERLVESGPFLVTGKQYQPLLWVAFCWNYVLIISGSIVLFTRLLTGPALYRKQALALFFTLALPLVWNLLFVFDVTDLPRKDLTPVMFAFSGLIVCLGVMRFRLFQMVPFAYRFVFHHMPDGVLIANLEDRLIEINPAAMKMTGFGAEAIGKELRELQEKDCPACSLLLSKEEVRTEYAKGEGEDTRWYEIQTMALKDRGKQDIGRLALIREITGRVKGQKAIESALADSRRHSRETLVYLDATRAIIEESELPEALLKIFDSGSSLIKVPDGFAGTVDDETGEVEVLALKQEGNAWVSSDVSIPLPGLAERAVQQGGPVYVNGLTGPSGTELPAGITGPVQNMMAAPVMIGDKNSGVLVLANKPGGFTDAESDFIQGLADIAALAITHFRNRSSLRHSYEKEKELRRSLEVEIRKRIDFTRALVHELKTPLTPVIATSEILTSGLKEEPWARMVQNVRRGADNLRRKIDELLDFARVEVGMLSIEKERVTPLPLLQSIADEMEYIFTSRHQQLVLELPESLPDIRVNSARLRQIVTNLVSNASRFSPDNSTVILRARSEGNFMAVEVEDKGIGISEEEQQTLFTPYDRTAENNERLSGLGLGLALSKSLVELQGGEIWVKSKKGYGSTFGFSVPYAGGD